MAIGYKEIEVAFPCASETEFEFTRSLIETPGAVPEDVTLEVITPCRKETLRTAVDSLRGARKAILFTYISTSDNFRDTILGISEEDLLQRVYECTAYARSITVDDPSAQNTQWSFGFGFEDFSNSRLDASVRLGETIKAAWRPTARNPLILGLAASVEGATPNVFADQVEYFSTNISEREKIILSVHPHNDRGCAVAAAELACLAGVDRVEGCLFGNGERAGNVDLVTLALNLYTQGIDPELDFSDLPSVRAAVEDIIKIPIHPRTPYAGEYYFLALSGGHQDGISKGLQRRGEDWVIGNRNIKIMDKWKVPYLPMDPTDIGVSHDRVIGINSQSGKSGVRWMLQLKLGLKPPSELAAEFSKTMKARSANLNRGLTADEICTLFLDTYHASHFDGPVRLSHTKDRYVIPLDIPHVEKLVCEGPECYVADSAVANLSRLLKVTLTCINKNSHQVGKTKVVAYVQCGAVGLEGEQWGVGYGQSPGTAYVYAILSAVIVGRSYAFPTVLVLFLTFSQKSNVFHLATEGTNFAGANSLHQATPEGKGDGAMKQMRNGVSKGLNGAYLGRDGISNGLMGLTSV